MTTTDTLREKVTLGLLDFEPACESPTHTTGGFGQITENHATHLITTPCGIQRMFCTEWVKAARVLGAVSCPDCHPAHHAFIDLDVVKL